MAWRGWVFTTARRRAIDEGRRRSRRRAALASEAADLAEVRGAAVPDPTQLVLERLDTQAALALVAQLAPLQAEVIALRVIAGLDVEPSRGWLAVARVRSGSPPTGGCADCRKFLSPRV